MIYAALHLALMFSLKFCPLDPMLQKIIAAYN